MTITLDDVMARLDRIEAQLTFGSRQKWQLVTTAYEQLGYKSARTLQRAIRDGRIPPRFVSGERSPEGKFLRASVDVEGFRDWAKGTSR